MSGSWASGPLNPGSSLGALSAGLLVCALRFPAPRSSPVSSQRQGGLLPPVSSLLPLPGLTALSRPLLGCPLCPKRVVEGIPARDKGRRDPASTAAVSCAFSGEARTPGTAGVPWIQPFPRPSAQRGVWQLGEPLPSPELAEGREGLDPSPLGPLFRGGPQPAPWACASRRLLLLLFQRLDPGCAGPGHLGAQGLRLLRSLSAGWVRPFSCVFQYPTLPEPEVARFRLSVCSVQSFRAIRSAT